MPFLLSQFLDACRWIGALLVLSVHATNIFVNLADIMSAPHSAPVYAWWFVVSWELGHQAVIGFFVMSGFLVGGAVIAQIRKRKDFLQEYLIHRFARIYMVTVPAIALTFLLDSTGRTLFAGAGAYEASLFTGQLSLGTLAGNLANLQGIWTSYFGTNGPLWSLACEFWYYVTFPLLLLPLARNYPPAFRIGGFAIGVALMIVLSIPTSFFLSGYSLWVIGALATLAPRPLIRSRWLALAIYAAAVIPIRLLVRGPLLAAHPWLLQAADTLTTLLFVNLLVTLRFGPIEGWDFLRSNLHRIFADFSFSLYCLHVPFLLFLCAASETIFGSHWMTALATPQHWIVMTAAMAASLFVAYLFSRFTEAKTLAARGVLRNAMQRLKQGMAAPAPAPTPAMVREDVASADRDVQTERVS
jgi:peptidoglycan/LPS O-acetylase OafA/YrhL